MGVFKREKKIFIHFNNFEGLSLNVLKIKEDFPDIKIIVSLHNYYLFYSFVSSFIYKVL